MLFILRFILLPFSVLYGFITSLRNFMYNRGILKSTSFDFPVITVGNLSVGGTGKTPQIEYLIRLLQNNYKLTVLSRGYKRKTKDFVLAEESTSVLELGDEPFQYHKKFDNINVAVHANRVEGIQKIKELRPNTEVVLLDDAYQHRKVKAGFQILLTAYSGLFYKDFMMPTGSLRELWWGKNRADIIVVTKCPENLSVKEQKQIESKINPKKHQQVFFSKVTYANTIQGKEEILVNDLKKERVILVTGIAKPKPLTDYLTSIGVEFEHLNFPDHHNFSEKELKQIQNKSINTKILTTEKDYVRLEKEIDNLYYLPIEIEFLDKATSFDNSIQNYVKK